MARTVAGLPEGTRITDFISLGVIGKVFPVETIREILAQILHQQRGDSCVTMSYDKPTAAWHYN